MFAAKVFGGGGAGCSRLTETRQLHPRNPFHRSFSPPLNHRDSTSPLPDERLSPATPSMVYPLTCRRKDVNRFDLAAPC
ncbi:hypothetical protein TWF696_001889 [Orbilia brochopaga]|uniref:Uncharacterized protein n=1 Tax=Orbilia brochopaga TaxID=3140254 RepID=A0AAV9UA46_9PEZI